MRPPTQQLAHMEWFFWELIAGLQKFKRWGNHPKNTPEDVLQHTKKTVVLTMFAIFLERRYSKLTFDPFTVLAMSVVHDWGEGKAGEITSVVKNDFRVKKALAEIESEMLERFLKEHLPAALCEDVKMLLGFVDNLETPEGKFFRAIETLGYVHYMLYEIYECRHFEFLTDFRTQAAVLDGLRGQYSSIDLFWYAMREMAAEHLPPISGN